MTYKLTFPNEQCILHFLAALSSFHPPTPPALAGSHTQVWLLAALGSYFWWPHKEQHLIFLNKNLLFQSHFYCKSTGISLCHLVTSLQWVQTSLLSLPNISASCYKGLVALPFFILDFLASVSSMVHYLLYSCVRFLEGFWFLCLCLSTEVIICNSSLTLE